MKLAKTLAKKYFLQGIFLLFTTILSTVVSLFIIELGRRIINLVSSASAQAQGSYAPLYKLCAYMFCAIISGGLISFFIAGLSSRLTQSVLKDIRLKLFNHMIRLPQDFYNNHQVGSILTVLTEDVNSMGQFFAKVFLLPVMNIVMIIFYAAYIFLLNWKLAIAAVITLPSVIFILPKLNRLLARLSLQYSRSIAGIADYLLETFTGISDLRAGQVYRYEESRFQDRIDDSIKINLGLAKAAGLMKLFMKIIRWLGPLLVYLYGGMLCLRGEILVGSLIACIGVINSLYEPLDSFVNFLQEWQEVKVRFNKLEEYLAIKEESEVLIQENQDDASTGDISFEDVKFGFNEREMLLKDIRFKVSGGNKAAFVGTSGSGKSLTSTLISRIYKPLAGRVLLGKKDVNSMPLSELRLKIGQVNQSPFLFNDSIRKNILYALLRKKGSSSGSFEQWIDFSLLKDIDNMEKLAQEVISITRQVGLGDDVYELGLRSKLAGEYDTQDNRNKILRARNLLLKDKLSSAEIYLEHYDQNLFMEQCSILENLVFASSENISNKFASTRDFCKTHLFLKMKENGLLDRLFNIGIKLLRQNDTLIKELYTKKSPLLQSLGFKEEDVEKRVKINQEVFIPEQNTLRWQDFDEAAVSDILELAYNFVPGESKEDLLDDKIKSDIIQIRKLLKKELPDALKEKLDFFDKDKYLESRSIRENICFGCINPLRTKAHLLLNDLIGKIAREAGLDELIFNLGLEFNVGERGNRLSGGQKQKVSIARVLLRNPSVLVLDEATASLDASSQSRITQLINSRFKGKTVISIAHRLSAVKDYDQVIVFDKGRIVQEGTFNELILKDGLFKKLYSEAN